MSKDFYSILGVSKDASPEDIKKSYRKLSKESHPDKHKGDKAAEQKFKEINEAYETLSDPEKKSMYDRFGSTGNAGGGARGGFDFSGFQNAQGAEFGGFGDLFETFFSGHAGSTQKKEQDRGRDLEMRVRISFMESVSGIRKMLSVRKLQACPECKGRGAAAGSDLITCVECGGTGQLTRMAQSFFGAIRQSVLCAKCSGSGKVPEKICPKCDGEGRVLEREEIGVEIPAGIADGQTVRLRSQGEAGRRGSPSGDLYVRIDVETDPRFVREGVDIHSSVTISVLQAILGDEIPVDTVHDAIGLKIPAGTQPHQVLRLKGKGMPVLQSKSTGDHYVTVIVEIPVKLSREERKIVEEWKRVSRQ